MSRRGPHSSASGSGREDCWSDSATSALIDAWGDRYLRLSRGNLRQKDWHEVVAAVNSRYDGSKSRKTDLQCKNRIDTLKKKYKVERSKPSPSKWIFFQRLDLLLGGSAVSGTKKLPIRSAKSKSANFSKGLKSPESSFDRDDDEEEEEEEEEDVAVEVKKEHPVEELGLSDEAACRELARAIMKFGEIYERIESSKQQQMMELERQRMEFAKDLEFQRMNMFVDAQLDMEKLKRQKLARSGKRQ